MKKQKIKRPVQGQDRTESKLSLSIIIPLTDDPEKLRICLDSLQKTKKLFEKDYEVILPVTDEAATKKILGAQDFGKALLEKGIAKITDNKPGTGIAGAVRGGLEHCNKENILIFEAGNIERSFNFDEFFHIPEKEIEKKNIILPVFREQELKPGSTHSPMILLRRSFAGYMLTLDEETGSSQDYQHRLFYYLSKLNIEAFQYTISQVNPFGYAAKLWPSFPGKIPMGINNFINWYFRIPLREIKTSPHKKYSFLDAPSYFRSLFVAAAFLIAVILPILSLDAGQSGDDEKHYNHAIKVYNYFATGGEDKSSLEDPKLKLNFYGQSIDLVTYLFNKTFNIENEYEVRHFIIGITGVLCILFAGLLATFLAGHRAGLITMIFMFLAPRFLGHSMNNPMDVPFALGYIFTLYHTFRFLNKLPSFSNRHAIWIMLGIAFTISIRIGGLLLIPYVGMFAGLYILFNRFEFKLYSKEWYRLVLKGAVYLVLISIGGFLISLIPWPYGFQSPLKNPFEALKMMANISVSLKVLFDGSIIWSNKLPWYYISMNILYTVPVVLLAGFFLNPLLYSSYKKQIKPLFIFFLYFVVIFPIAFVIYKKSNVYGGWRHLLFVFPAMAILSAVAWDRLVRLLKPQMAKLAVAVVLLGGMMHPLVHIVKNHPLEYIYFNELLGVKKAYGRFETDFYTHSLKLGTEWLVENVFEKEELPADSTIIVTSNGSIAYYLRHMQDNVRPAYTRYYDRGEKNWDYAVLFCNYIHPHQLNNGLWPPEGTIKTIDVNGIPVCAVIKRATKDDMKGIAMIKRQDYLAGIPFLEEVNRKHPNNEILKLRLAEAYIRTRQFHKVHPIMDECLEIYPDYDKALNLKGIAYMESGDINNARTTFLKITRINYRFAAAFYNLGLLYIRQQPSDVERAVDYFRQSVQSNSRYKPAYVALATIYRQQGYEEEARRMENIANSL